jgi:hypothetical protein
VTQKKQRRHNSTYPKVAVQCLNQAICIYQSYCLVDSEVLRNRHLRVAAKRYHRFINTKLKNLVFYKKLNRGGQNQDRRLEY